MYIAIRFTTYSVPDMLQSHSNYLSPDLLEVALSKKRRFNAFIVHSCVQVGTLKILSYVSS